MTDLLGLLLVGVTSVVLDPHAWPGMLMAAVAVRPRLMAALAGAAWELVLSVFAIPPPGMLVPVVVGLIVVRLLCAALVTAALNGPAQRYRARVGL